MKNCQWETEGKHVRQIHFRFYRLGICPPSLTKTQRTTTIKRTNRSNLRKIRIEGKALSIHLQNWVRIYIHNRHNRSCRELLSVYADHCLTNICTNSGFTWFLSLKYNWYRICLKNPNVHVKLFFCDFAYSWRAWREAFHLHDSKSQRHATYFFLNKTWSLSLNLKPHGILLKKQYKNLPLSLDTAMWLGWSFDAPRSRSTSNWMHWFNSKRWDVRESAYSHPSNSKKCMATDKAWSMCLAAVRCCLPYHCSRCQNYHPYHIFSKGNTHSSQGRSSVRPKILLMNWLFEKWIR